MRKRMELFYHLLTVHFLLLSVFSFPLQAETPGSKTDISALLAFKLQISSDPFGVLSSWNESLHHCKWPGVLCGRRHPDRVTALVLGSKGLSGSVSPSLANLTFLQKINLSDNNLQGKIPIELGYLHRLNLLNMSNNLLEGGIPSTLGNCTKLEQISINHNNLQGAIPSNFVQCKELKMISFRHNFLVGGIPPEFGFLQKLYYMGLQTNNLRGSIPSTLGNLSSLQYIFLDENRLSGSIPSELGKLKKLRFFSIYDNSISGEIPHSLCNISTIVALYFGANQLKGSLPLDIGDAFPNMFYLSLFENKLHGQIPPSIFNCSALSGIEGYSNYFSGIIPATIGNLQSLQRFLVGDNKLEARTNYEWKFVDALSNCTSLRRLDLGSNKLQGTMPSSLANLSTSLLDVRGNPMLCGGVPELHLPQCPPKSPIRSHHFHQNIMLISSIISSFIGLAIAIWLLATCYPRKTSHNNEQSANRVLKYELSHFSFNDLLKATEIFSLENLIGVGSFGKVYKVLMNFENVTTVAVKVLNLGGLGASKSFFLNVRY